MAPECPELRKQKNGTYYVQLDLGTDPKTGKRRRPRKTFPGMDRDEAQAAALAWYEVMSSDLLGDALEAYNATFAVRNTRKSYESARRRISDLWAVPVRAVSVAMLNAEFVKMRERGLSEGTVRTTKEYLSGAFRRFVSEGLCDANPVDGTMRLRQPSTGGRAIDDESLSLIVNWVDRELSRTPSDKAGILRRNLAFAVWLDLRTGVRIGEMCALRRQDLVTRTGLMTVNGTMSDGVRQEHTKSHNDRAIPLDAEDHDTIKEHMRWQRSYLTGVSASTPILTLDGSHIYTARLNRAWQSMLRELGIAEHYTFHNIRHTNATLLLQAGMSVNEVQQRLGHSDPAITVKIYVHVVMAVRDSGASSAINRQLRAVSEQY